jgi:hypothetical protein
MFGEWQRSSLHLANGSTLPPMGGRPSHSDFDEAADMAELKKGVLVMAIKNGFNTKQRRKGAAKL